MGKGISTINTVLKAGSSANALSQLAKIKSYPNLGGAPEQLETTDLEDVMQTFCLGVQSLDSMEFTCNYTPEAFTAVKATEGTEQYYALEMGDNGEDGKFTWQGSHSVYVTSGDVNAVREMVITCAPSTVITPVMS